MSAKITLRNTCATKNGHNESTRLRSKSAKAVVKWTKFIQNESHAKFAMAAIKQVQTGKQNCNSDTPQENGDGQEILDKLYSSLCLDEKLSMPNIEVEVANYNTPQFKIGSIISRKNNRCSMVTAPDDTDEEVPDMV